MKHYAEGGGQHRAKSHNRPTDFSDAPMDAKAKRLEDFRALIGEFEADDSYGMIRNSENSNNKMMPNTQVTQTPPNRLDTKQSRARKLKEEVLGNED